MRGPIRRRRGRLIAAGGRPEPSPHGIRMPSRWTACGHCDAAALPRAASRQRPHVAAPPPPLCGVRRRETIRAVTRGTGGGRRTHPPTARRGVMRARSGSERGSSKAGWFDNLPPGLARTVELLDSVVDSSSPVVATSSAAGCRDGERDAASQGEHVEDAVPHLSRAAGCRDWTARRPAACETHRRPPQMSPG